uniref:Uncharacterized protein n=1 Tax=Anguilla anguilla TaxID=7936 RepID=A0A0E9QQ90_ANGAN
MFFLPTGEFLFYLFFNLNSQFTLESISVTVSVKSLYKSNLIKQSNATPHLLFTLS